LRSDQLVRAVAVVAAAAAAGGGAAKRRGGRGSAGGPVRSRGEECAEEGAETEPKAVAEALAALEDQAERAPRGGRWPPSAERRLLSGVRWLLAELRLLGVCGAVEETESLSDRRLCVLSLLVPLSVPASPCPAAPQRPPTWRSAEPSDFQRLFASLLVLCGGERLCVACCFRLSINC